MKTDLFINGYDAYDRWGVSPSEGSYAALRMPPEKKERVKNASRLQHGTRYIGDIERYDERQITLPLHIVARDVADLNRKFDAFCREVLDLGGMEIIHYMNPGVKYKLKYIGCSNFTVSCGIAKFSLKLVEPNPNDRS